MVWGCRVDFASFLSWRMPAPSPGSRARFGGRGGVQAANTRGRGQGSLPGSPGSELLQRSQRRVCKTSVGQGAELPALTGTRAAGAFSGELPSGRARRPAPPRPGPLRPTRSAVPPFRPPTASLALQRLHSLVLRSASAALATTKFHSVASGRVWAGSSRRVP